MLNNHAVYCCERDERKKHNSDGEESQEECFTREMVDAGEGCYDSPYVTEDDEEDNEDEEESNNNIIFDLNKSIRHPPVTNKDQWKIEDERSFRKAFTISSMS